MAGLERKMVASPMNVGAVPCLPEPPAIRRIFQASPRGPHNPVAGSGLGDASIIHDDSQGCKGFTMAFTLMRYIIEERSVDYDSGIGILPDGIVYGISGSRALT